MNKENDFVIADVSSEKSNDYYCPYVDVRTTDLVCQVEENVRIKLVTDCNAALTQYLGNKTGNIKGYEPNRLNCSFRVAGSEIPQREVFENNAFLELEDSTNSNFDYVRLNLPKYQIQPQALLGDNCSKSYEVYLYCELTDNYCKQFETKFTKLDSAKCSPPPPVH